eukprot:scaffold436315_cov18-Prasinocladus_malaysianus.AAC.1
MRSHIYDYHTFQHTVTSWQHLFWQFGHLSGKGVQAGRRSTSILIGRFLATLPGDITQLPVNGPILSSSVMICLANQTERKTTPVSSCLQATYVARAAKGQKASQPIG